MIPYGRQSISDEDVKLISEIVKSDWLTTGPTVRQFEEDFARYVGSKYAVAVSSGTAALHVACLAAGLKKDDELITTPMTFCASSNCALYCGARPVFADIKDDLSGLIDPLKIKACLTSNTKIIIPVHYAGQPCDLEEIRHNIEDDVLIIEDACHALGATYKGTRIGDCSYSDMCVFSFHPVKHITTGEGGMITTNSKKLFEKLMMLRNHGITKDPSKLFNTPDGPWYYEMQDLGFNYRITDFQCALGASQLKRLDTFVKKRKDLAKKYDKAFENDSNLRLLNTGLNEDEFVSNSYHLYVIVLRDSQVRAALFNFLIENNIICQVHYIPVYWQPYYQDMGYINGLCPNAEEFYSRIISIPMFPNLKSEEQDFIINKIKSFFKE
ncbi:UDP-4-amino-4,6-dideoxy-N-acetyl-beta-L-altrosamine transaminase [Nanoarchaeota archaeon]